LDFIWVIAGLSLVLKFGLDPNNTFRLHCDFYILPFWLEIAASRQFLESFGEYFPKYGYPSF